MFDGPEYASYIALCRELRLEREWRVGDYVSVTERGIFACGIIAGPDRPTRNGDPIWLPRLDQLLAMLEEAGVEDVAFRRDPCLGWGIGDTPGCDSDGHFDWLIDPVYAPTREEAAARLWCAVTGHPSSRA